MAETAVSSSTTSIRLMDIFSNFLQKVQEKINQVLDPDNLLIIPELCHLSPILFTIGTFIFALLTMNYPIALFGVGALEAMALYSPLKMLGQIFLTPTDLRSGELPQKSECSSRFQQMTQYRFQDLINQGLKPEFPHYALYFLSFASGYMIQSMTFMSEEISMMGEYYSNRMYLSIIGAAMFIAVYLIHLSMYGCSSMSSLFFTIAIGIFVGILISVLHYTLGGKQAINTLFVPPIVKREGLDYLCVKTD